MARGQRTEHITGATGRVSSTVRPGRVGEVLLRIRGGTESYDAYAYTSGEIIAVGEQVYVMEYSAPRTVYVTPVNAAASPNQD